ncbi:hypothetical protein P3T23_008358 [Paraburkholderia sp. GAS448]
MPGLRDHVAVCKACGAPSLFCALTAGSADNAKATQAPLDAADPAMYLARRNGRDRVDADLGVPESELSPVAAADRPVSLRQA